MRSGEESFGRVKHKGEPDWIRLARFYALFLHCYPAVTLLAARPFGP